MSAVCWQVELNFISHRPFLKCSEGAEIWSPVGRGPISVSRGAQDLPEYLVGGKDSDLQSFSYGILVGSSVKKSGQKEQNPCIPVQCEWSLHPSGLECALPVHCADSSTHKMGYWASPARPPHSLDLGWLSELPSPLLIHVQAYCPASHQLWKRTAVGSLQWILRRFTGLPSLSPAVRQSTFQNAERPVVDFPLVDCQSTELQAIGYS